MVHTSGAIPWERVDSHTYERMVAVLLNSIHSSARRTDGAGGDEGKDVSFPGTSGHPVVFQLKSCTGRMNTSRWRQVKRSLKRAAELKPEAWHLVLPIDFTPAEEMEFKEIIAPYPFPCDYMGLTWLDARMAEHPVVPRYFLEGGDTKVVELLRELHAEQAALADGASDLVKRLQKLAVRADEVDPFYGIDFSVQSGTPSVSLRPRYPGAEADRPITVSAAFAFPDTPEARAALGDLEAAVKYGTAARIPAAFVEKVAVDAPAGFGGETSGGEFLIEGTAVGGPPTTVRIVLLGPDGRQIGSLPLTLGPRTVGIAGFQAAATDPSGCLTCRIRVDGQTRNMNIAYEMDLPPRCLPALALPTLRFLSTFGAPNGFQLAFEGAPVTVPTVVIQRPPLVTEEYVELVATFERVQARTGINFVLPETLSAEDYHELLEADKLTNGELVRGRWSGYEFTMEVGTFVHMAEAAGVDVFTGGRMSQHLVRDHYSEIAGQVIPLGPATRILYSAELDNVADVKAAYEKDPGLETVIRLKPGATDDSSLQLGAPAAAFPQTTA